MKRESGSSSGEFDLDEMAEESHAAAKAKVVADGLDAQELDQLVHRLTAIRLVEALQSPEVMHTPGLLQAAMRFCVDNKVTGLDVPEAAGAAVREAYKDKAPFKLAQ